MSTPFEARIEGDVSLRRLRDRPPRCPLCDSRRATQISHRLRNGLETRYPMFPHRCDPCGLVFLHPGFSAEEEAAFYREEFRALYHGQDYDLEAFHRRGLAEAKRRAKRLEKSGLLKGKILELGSATGYFLEEAQRRVAVRDCTGIELDEAQRRFSRQRGLRCLREIEDLDDEGFDLIALFHVLEHLSDPVGTLRKLAERLTAGGSIVVEVPNVDDALLSVYGIDAYQRFYWHPAHRLYFDRNSLEGAARRAGLRARVEAVQRYSLGNHLHWAVRREPGGQQWLDGFLSEETERSYAKDLCRTFTCDTLWMIAHRAGG